MVNILFTGRPGIGKTTAIKRIIQRLPSDSAAGFWTEEIRERGKRVGFEIITLDGRKGELAHVQSASPRRVGRYGVKIESIEKLAVHSLQVARQLGRIIIIDEIAKMELYAPTFAPEVSRCLDTARVIGTIQSRHGEFLDSVRSRDDVRILTLTEANREEAPDRVLNMLSNEP
jgi:nucleoside-triphosphatase